MNHASDPRRANHRIREMMEAGSIYRLANQTAYTTKQECPKITSGCTCHAS
jgi:hypothetical protein